MNARPNAVADPRTILIVDDERDNLELLALFLGWEGYLTVTAATGAEALAAVAHQAPDLILLDVMMPGMTGYQVAAEVKGNLVTKHIPIIMVTALNDLETRTRAEAAGAEGFVTKPVDRDLLMKRIATLLPTRLA